MLATGATTSTLNLRSTAAATVFICMYAISFPRHTLGPAWNTAYLAASTGTNSPPSPSHRSGTNSMQSSPHTFSILPMASSASSRTATRPLNGTGGYRRIASVVHLPLDVGGGLLVGAPLAARVRGEEPEEPCERRRRRVLPGEHEGDHHVAEEPALGCRRREHGAELLADTVLLLLGHGRHEQRQQVVVGVPVPMACLLRLDDGHGVAVDDVDGLPEPSRPADVEELGESPHERRRRQRPPERDLEGDVERLEERLLLLLQPRVAIDAERDVADGGEPEPAERGLEVDGTARRRGGVEGREEASPEVDAEDAVGEAAEGAGGEGVGRQLPLEAPEAAVGGEEPVADELGGGWPPFAYPGKPARRRWSTSAGVAVVTAWPAPKGPHASMAPEGDARRSSVYQSKKRWRLRMKSRVLPRIGLGYGQWAVVDVVRAPRRRRRRRKTARRKKRST
nr:unnamed protein product [Digitaria exilis]